MAKGDDAVRKKLNKANRKKLRKDDRSSSSVTARVASIIAAKKRRQSGKRRKCQGMCFSLPTLEDPFNDRNGRKDFEKETKKVMLPHRDESEFLREKCKEIIRKNEKAKNPGLKNMKVTSLKNEQKKSLPFTSIDSAVQRSRIDSVRTKTQLSGKQEEACENSDCPSKYLIRCLNEIENSLRCDGTYSNEEDKPLFVSTWGVEFWKCYSAGKDVLETSGTSSTIEQIAWIVSSAADSISRKDEEGPSAASPFLLFLVASQEKAAKVRSVCKPLKVLGIHTVSIHPGASLDHQIQGLKSSEPEFMISTPERLLELLSLKAIDLSGISWLIVDGLESFHKHGYLDKVNSIRNYISRTTRAVVFDDCFRRACVPVVQTLLMGSVHRLSLNDSVTSQSACIIQSVNMSSLKEKLSKAVQILGQPFAQASKVLYVVGKDSQNHKLVAALKLKGHSISFVSACSEVGNSFSLSIVWS
ncbi:uncharacterized protein LOC112193574 isoform X2 [Rosa chinensis]|uniref:uncharacterized protein LOC112193574 isoform X2 n=1 Tax=Rosa chinensis TaxID=74649 RepID=UPI001AD8E062|nr:uncharacterized protein LOC112193574 isoform X2 [Rosa chinensis]